MPPVVKRQITDRQTHNLMMIHPLHFYEQHLGKIVLPWIDQKWFDRIVDFNTEKSWQAVKRITDVLVSLVIIIVTLPIMLLATLFILIESRGRGPILYQQVRLGLHNQPFKLLKFRSMQINAEINGKAQWAKINDERVTRVGKWLRKTRIDELPQVINVLRGQMSFVGPRPERPEFVCLLEKKIPFYNERHLVKPGITGWAQICYPYGANEQDSIEKLQYDLYYVKNNNIFLDLVILLQTAEVILWQKGR